MTSEFFKKSDLNSGDLWFRGELLGFVVGKQKVMYTDFGQKVFGFGTNKHLKSVNFRGFVIKSNYS